MTPEVDSLEPTDQEVADLNSKEDLVNSPTLVDDIRNHSRILRLMFGDTDESPVSLEVPDHKKSPEQRGLENDITAVYGS
jgi:hypothetical protein